MTNIKFNNLSTQEKIKFFVKCQELLVKYHPKSHFVATEKNWHEKKQFIIDFFTKYKGYVYQNNEVCILYNLIKVNDPRDPIKTIKNYIYKEPDSDPNGYSVDFVVFRHLKDCIPFIQEKYSPEFKYIIFVKNNEPKLYDAQQLVSRLSNLRI